MRTRLLTLATAGWLVAAALVAVIIMDGGAVLLADANSLADTAPDTAAIHRITPHENYENVGNDGTTGVSTKFRQTTSGRKLLQQNNDMSLLDLQGNLMAPGYQVLVSYLLFPRQPDGLMNDIQYKCIPACLKSSECAGFHYGCVYACCEYI